MKYPANSYETPSVDTIYINVEQGFANSPLEQYKNEDWDNIW